MAIPPPVIALVTTIATWIGRTLSVYFVGTTIRDVAAGVSTPVEESQDETIQAIIDDPTLSEEDKKFLIDEYLKGKGEEDWSHTVMMVAVVIGVAYVVATYFKGK